MFATVNTGRYFAVGRTAAYDVTPYSEINEQDKSFYCFEPVVKPAAYYMWPDEGRSGLLT